MIDINIHLKTAIIELDNAEEYTVKILDASGAVIEIVEVSQNQFKINYAKYEKGNYAVKLESSTKTIVKTFEI